MTCFRRSGNSSERNSTTRRSNEAKKLGKSVEELWSDIGYEVHKHETIDDKIEKGFERMANTMANTMASAMTNAMTENNKFLKEHFANNQITTPRDEEEDDDDGPEMYDIADSPDKPKAKAKVQPKAGARGTTKTVTKKTSN